MSNLFLCKFKKKKKEIVILSRKIRYLVGQLKKMIFGLYKKNQICCLFLDITLKKKKRHFESEFTLMK